jgi:hypothetical protein
MGTAAHTFMAEVIRNGGTALAAVFAARYGVDAEELASLTNYGYYKWKELSKFFPDPEVEIAVERVDEARGIRLTGTADVRSQKDLPAAGRFVAILDWKFGRVEPSTPEQGLGYLWGSHADMGIFAAVMPRMDRILLHPLQTDPDNTVFVPREELEEWWGKTADNIVNWNGGFKAGAHCGFCPRLTQCPGHAAHIKQILSLVVPEGGTVAISPTTIIMAYELIRSVEQRCKAARDAVRRLVEQGGSIEADGRILRLVEKHRESIEPVPAWPILSMHLTEADLPACVSIRKGETKKKIMATAPKGQKGAVWDSVMAEITAAGGISTKTSFSLELTGAKLIEAVEEVETEEGDK